MVNARACERADVCIVGGGMAGLTVAHQIKDRCPDLAVVVLEHRTFPVPEAAHKVGESTVEIAAHYLAEQLNLREYLESEQLPKFGLRLFFGGDRKPLDLAEFDEVGASRVLPVPTYQLDRGALENYLARAAAARGIRVADGATVREMHIDPGRHLVRYGSRGEPQGLRCRYLVDASGRRAWLRRQRGISRKAQHRNGATWFRVQGDVDVNDWSADSAWQKRCQGLSRRFSTNHFLGPGYWAWVIPLASRATSIGLVYDTEVVDADHVRTRDGLLAWLAREQPLLAAGIEGAPVMDFHSMRDYAVGAREMYSHEGWMLSGDAGVFTDPFYSPGGDFIAIGNTFITEIIARGDDAGGRLTNYYQRLLLSFFATTLSLYTGQYPGFGHRDLMVVKTAWDYAYYWAVLAKLYFSGRMVDVAFMRDVDQQLTRAAVLNAGVQRGIRGLAAKRVRQGGEGRFVDHYRVPLFHALKNDLLWGAPECAATALADGVSRLGQLAEELFALLARVEAGRPLPDLDRVASLS